MTTFLYDFGYRKTIKLRAHNGNQRHFGGAGGTGAGIANVLVLCTGNSCRSILGEATFNHLAPEGWRAISAG
jgi:hypothetical protein